jgi:NCAIR mutase (PurE)-related protein
MTPDQLRHLADQLVRSEISRDEFVRSLLSTASAELGEATLDLDRRRRCGFPEVVFGQGKTVPVLIRIFERLLAEGSPVLATRISADQAAPLLEQFPQGRYNEIGRTFRIEVDWESEAPAEPGKRAKTPPAELIRTSSARQEPRPPTEPRPPASGPPSKAPTVAVITAGTSDLPVAEEARETLDWMGIATVMIHDVGVAGPHRLPAHLHKLQHCDAIVVVAGMEGALPSVVGGYVSCPVIAVPTSVGYGASFGGIAALLGMLNSCASNVTVVNIDAGFKGGYVAGLIAKNRHDPRDENRAS